MKSAVVFTAILATTAAFAPAQSGKATTALNAEKKPFFNRVFGMDLFAHDPEVNTYGARNRKQVSNCDAVVVRTAVGSSISYVEM